MAILLCVCVFIVPGIYALIPGEAAAQEGAKAASCSKQRDACISKLENPEKSKMCWDQWKVCMRKKCARPSEIGSCREDVECQKYCTEVFDSKKNETTTCCEGGPRLSNTCRTRVYGKKGSSMCLGEGETIEDIRKKLHIEELDKEVDFAELVPKKQSPRTPRISSAGSRGPVLPSEENKNGLERLMAGIREPFEKLVSFARGASASSDAGAPHSGETPASAPGVAPSSMGILVAETASVDIVPDYAQSYFSTDSTFGGGVFDTVGWQGGNWIQQAMLRLWPGSWF